MTTTPTPAALVSDEQLDKVALQLDCSGRAYFQTNHYIPWQEAIRIRDQYEAERQQAHAKLTADQARIVALTERCESIFGDARHLDGLTDTQLERYSQLSPPEMFKLLIRAEESARRLDRIVHGEPPSDDEWDEGD